MPKATSLQLPKARTDHLIVKEVAEEVVVYDLEREKAHCLNRTAALVWKSCNGRRSVADLQRILAKGLDAPIDEQVVLLALSNLEKKDLLSSSSFSSLSSTRISRREAMKKAGSAAVYALPVVTSIIAPTAAMGATCRANGQACTASAQCCSTCCCSDTGNTCQTKTNQGGICPPGHCI